jgi:glycerol-3-phosphate acyltransferase PlsY
LTWVLLVLISYLFGSLPFSVWLGKIFLKVDVRQYGDGNPGAANVFRSGNRAVGLAALILDISKAAVPVGISYNNIGIRGIPMLLVALAPILGHVFSPFLRFHGGKAIATSLGVWIGLTFWKASLLGVMGTVIGISLVSSSGWSVMLGLVGILLSLIIWLPDPLMFAIWVGETIILIGTHRADLSQRPSLRSWVTKRLFAGK